MRALPRITSPTLKPAPAIISAICSRLGGFFRYAISIGSIQTADDGQGMGRGFAIRIVVDGDVINFGSDKAVDEMLVVRKSQMNSMSAASPLRI